MDNQPSPNQSQGPPPSESAPKSSVWSWLVGKPVTPAHQTPPEGQTQEPIETPSFYERLVGRGPYMKTVQKIRADEHKQYWIQKRRLEEALRRQQFETQKNLMKSEQQMFGVHGYNLKRYDDRINRMSRYGNEKGLEAAERESNRVAKRAQEKYMRLQENTMKAQRQWERQQKEGLKKERDMRIKQRLEDLRMQNRMQSFQDSPQGSLDNARPTSSRSRRGLFGGLFSR